MSIRVMTAVWDSKAYDGGTLLVLLALADWAKDDGTKVFPTLHQVMEKARLSERGARDCLRNLEKDGTIVLMVRADGTPGRANEWRIDLDRLHDIAEAQIAKREGRFSNGGRKCPRTEEHPENTVPNAPNTDQSVVVALPANITGSTDSAVDGGTPQNIRGQITAAPTTGADASVNGGNLPPQRGQIEAPTGADNSTPPIPPYIDQPSYQPPYQPPSQPPLVRASDATAENDDEIPDSLRRGPDAFEDFMRAGEWHTSTTRLDVLNALRAAAKAGEQAPPLADLAASARAYFAARTARNARRRANDPEPAVKAGTFIRNRMWQDFPLGTAKVTESERAPDLSWADHPLALAALKAQVGDGEFGVYFAPCQVVAVDDKVAVIAKTSVIRDRLLDRHQDRLNAAFGRDVYVASIHQMEAAA